MAVPALSAILLPELSLTTQQFSWISSVYAFSAGISAFLATAFIDRFDRKRMLLLYYGGFVLGMLMCAVAQTFWMLLLARTISGLFGGVVASICFAMIADRFQTDQRGRVMGFVQLAFAAGFVVGLPAALYLATNYHWQWMYWCFFIYGAILWAIALIVVKASHRHFDELKNEPLYKHSLRILKRKNYWVVFSNNIFLVLGDVMFMTFGTAYMANNLGLSVEDIPLLFTVSGLTTIVLSPIIGRLADRYGVLPVFSIGTALAIATIAVFSNLGELSFGWVACIFTLLYVGVNARMVTSTALTTVIPDEEDRGAFMTLDASLQQIAGGLAATAAGWIIYQHSDGTVSGYPFLGGVVIALMGLTLILMRRIDKKIKHR